MGSLGEKEKKNNERKQNEKKKRKERKKDRHREGRQKKIQSKRSIKQGDKSIAGGKKEKEKERKL